MKYLKYCENNVIGTNNGQKFLGRVEGQPKHGPTVICFKNPDTEETCIAYTGKNIYKEDESPIQYTWRYEASYNGHPAIIVNFSQINGYSSHIICLESNNMSKGTGTKSTMPVNKYKLKGENNNRALNVFDGQLLTDYEDITYYKLKNITLNTDYPIYITVPTRYKKWAENMVGEQGKTDWETRINVRPTIRGTLSQNYPNINEFTFRHTNDIPAQEYMSVKFPYVNIFEL